MIGFFMPPRHRKGHHGDYLKFLTVYWSLHQPPVFDTLSAKIRAIVRHPGCLVALDPERSDLWPLLFAALLNRLHLKSVRIVGVGVLAGDFLKQQRNFLHLIKKRGRVVYLKTEMIKGALRFIKKSPGIEIISIHQNNKYKNIINLYYSRYILDFQYYDLNYLNIKSIKPFELNECPFPIETSILVFLGSNQDRRNIHELLEYAENPARHLSMVLVGKIMNNRQPFHQCINIPRYVSEGELIWLMKNCRLVYSFYNNEAPSGFFGRATQLGKWVLVKEGGYLHHEQYPMSIAIRQLEQLNDLVLPTHTPSLSDWQERINNPRNYLQKPC